MTVREGMEGRGRGEVVNSAIKARLFLIAKHNEVWRGGGGYFVQTGITIRTKYTFNTRKSTTFIYI